MESLKLKNKKYLFYFFSSFAALLLIAEIFCEIGNSEINHFRGANAIDFRKMDDKEILLLLGMNRRQRGMVKIGYLEEHGDLEIGIFGNHQIGSFSKHPFKDIIPPEKVFNFWFANFALPELRDLIYYLSVIGKLPEKVILVGITTPNNDNGNIILNHGTELPLPLRWEAQKHFAKDKNVIEVFRDAIKNSMALLHYKYNYITFFSGLSGFFGEPGGKKDILNIEDCRNLGIKQKNKLPGNWIALQEFINRFLQFRAILHTSIQKKCDLVSSPVIGLGILNDGSNELRDSMKVKRKTRLPKLNEYEIKDSRSALKEGDEHLIAKYMREINQIGVEHGRKVVFFIPPVYETKRESLSNKIFDKALEELENISVIDHRRLYLSADYFRIFDHPAHKYFDLLVNELVQRGIIKKQTIADPLP